MTWRGERNCSKPKSPAIPTDDDLLNAAAQIYLAHGLFTNALAVVDHKLRLTPDDPGWLFNRGYVSIQTQSLR